MTTPRHASSSFVVNMFTHYLSTPCLPVTHLAFCSGAGGRILDNGPCLLPLGVVYPFRFPRKYLSSLYMARNDNKVHDIPVPHNTAIPMPELKEPINQSKT